MTVLNYLAQAVLLYSLKTSENLRFGFLTFSGFRGIEMQHWDKRG